jgi:8-oxo-dGTP pyrophosphatase MutT (NUDIX family)
MRHATLCFLIKEDPPQEILLGFKKVGFGAGKYNGFGGKVQADETIAMAAVRELEEETGVSVREVNLQRMGHLTFLFSATPDWDQVVHVYLARTWDGEPVESREMKPAWFAVDDIPFERMWQDDAHWLPRVLAGERIWARFTFKEDNETIDDLEIEIWRDEQRRSEDENASNP